MTAFDLWLGGARCAAAGDWRAMEPLPAVLSVSVPEYWFAAPRAYWYEVANHVLSLNHALKRYYAKPYAELLKTELALWAFFNEEVP